MGAIPWFHLIVVAMVWLIPLFVAAYVFVFLARIARDVQQIRKLLQSSDEKLRD